MQKYITIIKYKLIKFLFYALLIFNFLGISYANNKDNIFKEDMVEVKFISSLSHIENHDNFYIGLKFKLEEGWKIYWRQPGDAGLPPKVDFSNSENIKDYKIYWPFPEKEYEAVDILTNIYKNEVILPIKIYISDLNTSLKIIGNIYFQVCKEICIPFETTLKLKIEPGTAFYTEDHFDIIKAISNVPKSYNNVGINLVELIKQTDKKFILKINSSIDFPDGKLDLFLEDDNKFYKIYKLEEIINNNNEIQASFEFKNNIDNLENLDLTIVKGSLSFFVKDINVITKDYNNLLLIIGIALLGGVILNFMPCVLPVLTLKVSRVVSSYNISVREVRLNFLYTSLGVIFSFLILALILYILKSFGAEVGWGIQFQQPIFICVLISILIIFSANLLNFIKFNLSSNFNNFINKFIDNREYGKSFFEGAFATLLSTPCSAPFLGTAVGFALASNSLIIFLIFLFLGIGMSLPYLIICLFPKLIKLLPKPGSWINYLRYILSAGLFLTGIWLLSILLTLIGWKSSLLFILFLVLVLFLFNYKIKFKSIILASYIIISFIFINYIFSKNIDDVNIKNTYDKWEVFNEEHLIDLVNNNKTVFVDITADWCVTCKVNKILVLNNKNFFSLVKQYNIVLMRGDWTKQNKNIANFMHKLNRYGIPFNAIYNKNNIQGVLFSELLSIEKIEEKFKVYAY